MAEIIEQLLARAVAGITPLPDISSSMKQTAMANVSLWLQDERFSAYRELMQSFIEDGRWELLLDCCYQSIPFGTGGRRGTVGVGPNRINPYMINASVQGHCAYLREKYPELTKLTVVVAYDVRAFKDANGIFSRRQQNPLLGLSSRDLAHGAAEVYAANDITVFTIAADDTRLISTPELSFLIRRLSAVGGINISASHNPPDDNGGKVYNRFGAQDIPPDDEHLAEIVARTTEIKQLPFEQAVAAKRVIYIPLEDREAYIKANLALSLQPQARQARIVYTPLHGTGINTVGRVLREAGFDLSIEPEQAIPDGDFPTVKFRIPNPEVPQSMEQAVAYAKQQKADLVLSSDPDADRIGMMAPDCHGDWLFYNGNQIAALVADYIITQRTKAGTMPAHPVAVKTEVTSELFSKIAREAMIAVVDDLLVGFKYIAEVIQNLGHPDDFLIGAEESHGILITPKIRDKDAAGAALYLGELASLLKQRGMTMDQHLRSLYRRYGYYGNRLASLVLRGAVGMGKIEAIQNALRQRPPQTIDGMRVVSFTDHQDEKGPFGTFKSQTDRMARNVLILRLENGARIILRPSGTEPKIKIYFELGAAALGDGVSEQELDAQIEAVDAALQELSQRFVKQVLSLIEIQLPGYALELSDLIPVDHKVDFVASFLPQLEGKAHDVLAGHMTSAEATQWIESYLAEKGYGKDPRGLVGKGFDLYIEQNLAAASPEKRALLLLMREIFHRGL